MNVSHLCKHLNIFLILNVNILKFHFNHLTSLTKLLNSGVNLININTANISINNIIIDVFIYLKQLFKI